MVKKYQVAKAIWAVRDDQMYLASKIAADYLGETGSKEYNELRKAIYYIGWTKNPVFPDNCLKDSSGSIIRDDRGRPKTPDDEPPMYLGSTLKSLVEDVITADHERDTHIARSKRRRFHLTHLKASCLLLCILTFGVGVRFIDNLLEARLIWKAQGPQPALDYLKPFGDGDVKSMIDASWYSYKSLKYSTSLKILDLSLKREDLIDSDKAKIFFIQAAIFIDLGDFEKASQLHIESSRLYENDDNDLGLARITLEQARILNIQNDFSGALKLIEESIETLGYTLDVVKQLIQSHYGNKDFTLVIFYCEMILDSDIVEDRIIAHMQLSRCHFLLGDTKSSFHHMWKADALIENTGNSVLRYYNMAQKILIAKCLGVDVTDYRLKLVEWAQNNEQLVLLKQLNDITLLDCPSVRLVEAH